ncbi:unnamed protein product, partial [Amoebophrya sp. A25]
QELVPQISSILYNYIINQNNWFSRIAQQIFASCCYIVGGLRRSGSGGQQVGNIQTAAGAIEGGTAKSTTCRPGDESQDIDQEHHGQCREKETLNELSGHNFITT